LKIGDHSIPNGGAEADGVENTRLKKMTEKIEFSTHAI